MRKKSLIIVALISVSLSALGFALIISDLLKAASGGGYGDFQRQWAVCQYIHAGRNPYTVCLEIIQHGIEAGDPDFSPQEIHGVREVPGWQQVESVLPGIQPPDPTYPPSSILLLTYTAGLLPASLTAPAWATLNLVLLIFVSAYLIRQAFPDDRTFTLSAAFLALGLILAWPPTRSVFFSSQFAFFCMAFVFLALEATDRNTWLAGIWFALALFKPSFTLLFLCYPVVRGRFAVVVIAGAIHAIALLILSQLLGCPPLQLVKQWLEVTSHFMTGMYSIQEIIGRFHLNTGPAGNVLKVLLLGSIFLWCVYNRSAAKDRLIDFLCFANLLWMYHGDYDFTLLLLPMMHSCRRLYSEPEGSDGSRAGMMELVCYAIIGAALVRFVYQQEHILVLRLLRWSCRFALIGMFAWHAARLARGRSVEQTVAAMENAA